MESKKGKATTKFSLTKNDRRKESEEAGQETQN